MFVDHDQAGEVGRGQTTELQVQPGHHLLRVSVEFEHSLDWSLALSGGDVVELTCRSRRKAPHQGSVDLFLVDTTDHRAHIVPSTDDGMSGRA